MPSPSWKDRRTLSRRIIASALQAADPAEALREHWSLPARSSPRRCILAVGKASVPMMREAHRLLKGRYAFAVLTTVPDAPVSTRSGRVLAFACDHPFPTARNARVARAILAGFSLLGEEDELIVLLSGGASAHLTLPAPGLTVREIAKLTRLLQRAGATIEELNTVRKHCELLKGGRFAAGLGCRVRSYVLSDVIGDPLDVIGSGPTAPDPTTFADALSVLRGRRLLNAVPAVTRHLRRGAAGDLPETPKPGDPRLAAVKNTVIASNTRVVSAVAASLRKAGFRVGVSTGGTGESARVAAEFVRGALTAGGSGPRAWVLGGETTVTVGESRGVGGPSQEFALAGAVALQGRRRFALLTFSTDGRDGPTDAAGGFVTGESCRRMIRAGVDPVRSLWSHDSRVALLAGAGLIRVRPTGTNLNHIAVLMRYP